MDLLRDHLPDLLTTLVPDTVSVAETYTDTAPTAEATAAYAEEMVAVERSVPSRRQEFVTGRACARTALAKLGQPPVPIPRGPNGAPTWPAGIVGSITHCNGYRAAAVARRADVSALGIDAEPNSPLPAGVLDLVSLPAERHLLARLAATTGPSIAWDRVLFSAKESVYKVWYPLVGTFLDFVDAELDIDAVSCTFTARLLLDGPVVDGERWRDIPGRFSIGHGFVTTAIARESR